MPLPTSLYHVHAYAYGCAHDGDGHYVTTDLESALAILADELDAYADYLADAIDDDESDDERESTLATLDTLKRSADAWSEATARPSYGHRGAREALEGALAMIDDHGESPAEDGQSMPSAWRVELLEPFAIGIDEPGSFARGRTFVVDTVPTSDALGVETLEELEELAESDETAASILEELEDASVLCPHCGCDRTPPRTVWCDGCRPPYSD